MTDEQTERDHEGRFLPGNTIWQERTTFGRAPAFADAEFLWQACRAYFQWAHENPLYEAKILASGKEVPAARMRAFTQKALCLHLRISEETWREWRKSRDDLTEVIQTVDAVIFTQKFEGAAAGLLNANLISRELGLADRQELTGKDGSPMEIRETPLIETARGLAFILNAAIQEQSDPANDKEMS